MPIADGLLTSGPLDAVAGTEVVAAQVHVVSQDARTHGHGDLAGAAGLGSVADAPGDHGHGVAVWCG